MQNYNPGVQTAQGTKNVPGQEGSTKTCPNGLRLTGKAMAEPQVSRAPRTSLWVLAGSIGRVSSTVASKVLSAKPTS